jgi:hypothetical protein
VGDLASGYVIVELLGDFSAFGRCLFKPGFEPEIECRRQFQNPTSLIQILKNARDVVIDNIGLSQNSFPRGTSEYDEQVLVSQVLLVVGVVDISVVSSGQFFATAVEDHRYEVIAQF